MQIRFYCFVLLHDFTVTCIKIKVYLFAILDGEKESEERGSDDVTLSMKGAVLTFVGLFILGCVVGIVQVLIILHVRSKRSVKQPGNLSQLLYLKIINV